MICTVDNKTVVQKNFTSVGNASLTWTCESEGTYRICAGGTSTGKVYIKDVMFSLGSDSPAYEPYRGQTITLPFGQTVYGGTLDWTTGVLTVTTKFFSLTGDERWEYVSKNNGIARYWLVGTGAYGYGNVYLISSQFKHITDSSVYEVGVYATGAATNGIINIHMDSEGYPDVESFKSFLRQKNAEGTPVEIVSQIGVPYTIQLTPQEILALSGVNTIYTDTGDVTVSGRADPNSVIQKLASRIAALESAAVTNA